MSVNGNGTRPLLEVRDLRARYGQVPVLHGIDFTIGGGEIVVILGANGAGKTTTMRAICGLVHTEGSVRLDGNELVVGPFQGLPACVRIPLDKGVCGAAARTRLTQRIEDVNAFPGHIACDSASNSELVVPLVAVDGALVGVFDLDSPRRARFDADDQAGLEALANAFIQASA